jgi:hypothetical protein
MGRKPGGAMTNSIQESRLAFRVSVLGMLTGCLAFWAVFAALVLRG